MKVLYFDCFSGISGDMTLGALLDLGVVAHDRFAEELEKLHIDGYEIKIGRSVKNGITGTDVDIILDHESGECDTNHSHGDHKHHVHEHHHEHHGDDNHHEHHEHEHHGDDNNHEHHTHKHHTHEEHPSKHVHSEGEHHHDHKCISKHTHQHVHRSYKDIKALIEGSHLTMRCKELSLLIFTKLAKAEGKIHGVAYEEVHFHEVGAVDSIVDIVGTAILVDMLDIEKLVCSPVPVGNGMVKCQHGWIPVPAPATLELLKGLPVYATGIKGELVTPTGAAILSALCTEFGEYPAMVVEQIGYGMGKKSFDIPNCLRVCVGNVSKK